MRDFLCQDLLFQTTFSLRLDPLFLWTFHYLGQMALNWKMRISTYQLFGHQCLSRRTILFFEFLHLHFLSWHCFGSSRTTYFQNLYWIQHLYSLSTIPIILMTTSCLNYFVYHFSCKLMNVHFAFVLKHLRFSCAIVGVCRLEVKLVYFPHFSYQSTAT